MTPDHVKIGCLELDGRLVLAPMAGVTDLAFRLLCREAGASLVATEMLSDMALLAGSRRSLEILTISPYERPVSCQICGSNPVNMAKAARIIAEAGADVIDINMGCPAPKIVGNREGAALMCEPTLATEIVAAVREALPACLPVTAKIRAGWDESTVNAVDFAVGLERAGVAGLTIHGRVRSQFYSGSADWDIIRQVKEAVRVPVTGNGDVRTGRDAVAMLERTGCDLVMIGRGALGNPAVFAEARRCLSELDTAGVRPTDRDARRAGPGPELASLAVRHFRAALALKGTHRGLVEMRKHGAWYISGRRGAAKLRQRLMQATTPESAEACLREALAPEAPF